MTRKALLKQKMLLESLIAVNMAEANYIRESKDIDWAILDTYYLSGRALAAEHMQIINQLVRK